MTLPEEFSNWGEYLQTHTIEWSLYSIDHATGDTHVTAITDSYEVFILVNGQVIAKYAPFADESTARQFTQDLETNDIKDLVTKYHLTEVELLPRQPAPYRSRKAAKLVGKLIQAEKHAEAAQVLIALKEINIAICLGGDTAGIMEDVEDIAMLIMGWKWNDADNLWE